MRTILRAYLAELHAVSDSKNQLRSLFFQPNSFSFSNSTKDLLKKKWSGPQIHGFGGVPQMVFHNIRGEITRHYH
jgi:hypothetical protein